MALCFLLDENLRGPLWQAIQQHNALGVDVLDVLCVGQPLGTLDPDLLLWIEANGRVLVSLDRHMVGAHLNTHWQQGHHVPGLLLLRHNWSIPDIIAALVLYDQCYEPPEMIDRVDFIP